MDGRLARSLKKRLPAAVFDNYKTGNISFVVFRESVMKRCVPQAALLAAALVLAAPASAITVSGMSAWSGPNEPLKMDITLDELGAAKPGDVRVRVASAADHARLGLSRPDWADSVRFTVLDDGGKLVARARSGESVGDGPVTFIVELQALGGGRLQQVYSALNGSPLASSSASEVTRSEPAPGASNPSYVEGEPVSKPKPRMSAPKPSRPKPAPVAAPEPAPAAAPAVEITTEPVAAAAPATAEPAVVVASNVDMSAPASGQPETLEALQQERAVVQTQLQDAQAMVAQFEARLQALDARETELNAAANPDAATTDVAVDEVVTEDVASEPAAEPAPAESASGRAPHEVFSIVMLAFIGLILLGIFAVNSLMARRK